MEVCWVQGVGSQSGLVIDDFTLQKPANWRPSPAARLQVINQGFQSNHTDTFIEVRGTRPIVSTWGSQSTCCQGLRSVFLALSHYSS